MVLIDQSKVSINTVTVDYIDLKLPNNFKNSNWSISINGKKSNSKYFNLRPSITSITSNNVGIPIQTGGIITIVGNYLNTNIYFKNNKLQGCTYGGNDDDGGDIYCTIPNGGSGKFLIISESINPYDTVNDVERSDPYEYQYNSPVINTIKPTGFYSALLSTKITITGSNYITSQSLVSVNVSSLNIPCNINKLTITSIECSFSSSNDQWPSSVPVVVTVDGLSSTSSSNQFSHFISCPSGNGGISCSGNGDCNSLTGLCICFNGYQSKPDCSVFTQTTISTITTVSSTTSGGSSTTTTSTSSTTTTVSPGTIGGTTTIDQTTTNNPSPTSSGSTTKSSTTTTPTTQTSSTTSTSTTNPTNSSDDGSELVSTSNNNLNFNYLFVLLIIIVSCLL